MVAGTLRRVVAAVAVLVVAVAVPSLLPLVAQERQPSSTMKAVAVERAKSFNTIDKKLTDLPKVQRVARATVKEANPRKHYGREERLRRIPKPTPKRDALMAFPKRAGFVRLAGGLTAAKGNVQGQGFSSVNPPDPVGDAGPEHFIQAINKPGRPPYS